MKKILSISFVLILAIGLTACGETKEEKAVNNAVNNISNMAERNGEKVDDQTKEMMKNALNSSKEFQQDVANEMAQMPKIIKVTKSYRNCLSDADDKDEAIECYNDADKLADELGIVQDDEELNADEEFGDWTADDKAKLIDEMDQSLKEIEQYMK